MSASLAGFERHRPGISNTSSRAIEPEGRCLFSLARQFIVFKSGPLFISCKGIGWTSWKNRWFILTRTSLVFFKNDPSALPQRDSQVNLTLGGIGLNNSGSVVVREDKKLLTVLFPDGRDGRAFTLKAESLEDLYGWKTALESALAQAPSAALVMGHDGIFRNDAVEAIEGSFHQWREKCPVKSLVVGRPILLALEDIDGGPSFLEKALRFLEKYGTKVEGILRQSADVEEVDRRVQEFEQGKNEFSPDEDAHVIGDCVKHVLRELPSSPVSASCCTALLEAYKIDRKEARVHAIKSAIQETFPEPNRRLLQRILKMMHKIASNSSENRMGPSAVAACMAPLILRPLLAGEYELDDDYDTAGDVSAQLLAAANAANNAQAIVTTLLDEYENIFDDENLQRCSISADSRMENTGSEDPSNTDNIDVKVNGYHDAEDEVHPETGDDKKLVLSGKLSESSALNRHYPYDYKAFGRDDSDHGSPKGCAASAGSSKLLGSRHTRKNSLNSNEQFSQLQKETDNSANEVESTIVLPTGEQFQSVGEILSFLRPGHTLPVPGLEGGGRSMEKFSSSNNNSRRSTLWGRNTVRKATLNESVDSSGEEELAIQRLEITKNDLRQRIAKEARGNTVLLASLERRKQALHERRVALEQDVARLQEQLQADRDLRAALEAGLSMSSGWFSGSCGMDSKTRAELEEIALAEADVARSKQKVAELHHQLNQQRQNHYGSLSDASNRYQQVQNSQQRFLAQDFDSTLALYNHERKQRTEEGDWRAIKDQSNRLGSGKQSADTSPLSDSKNTEPSATISVDDLGVVDSESAPSASRLVEGMEYRKYPSVASSALVALTTRLDFFKERRSQLMEQLHNLDLNYGNGNMPPSQDFLYRSSSPSWS